jgi:hypothetical protein
VRHTTSSTFKAVKIRQVAKSRRYSSEPHDLSAGWANRRPWRTFTRVFVAQGRKPSLNRNVGRTRPATALAHQCGNCELTYKQKNWYRIRVFGDDRHRGDLPRGETCIGKDIRRSYWFYAKVGMAGVAVPPPNISVTTVTAFSQDQCFALTAPSYDGGGVITYYLQ